MPVPSCSTLLTGWPASPAAAVDLARGIDLATKWRCLTIGLIERLHDLGKLKLNLLVRVAHLLVQLLHTFSCLLY